MLPFQAQIQKIFLLCLSSQSSLCKDKVAYKIFENNPVLLGRLINSGSIFRGEAISKATTTYGKLVIVLDLSKKCILTNEQLSFLTNLTKLNLEQFINKITDSRGGSNK